MRDDPGFNFSTFFIKNPATTVILTLIVVLLGVRSFFKLPLELFPNVEFPVVVITTVYPGAAPQEVETLVTKPIEDALAGLNGLEDMQSVSREGMSRVVCSFTLETSNKDAAQDVRDKVSAVLYKLPKEAKPPSYSTFSTSSRPIVSYAVEAPLSPVALSTYLKETLKPKLDRVPGVAEVQLQGNVERTIEVTLDPERLSAYQLSLPGIFQAIQGDNYNLPGGKLTGERDLPLRTMGKVETPEALALLRISTPTGSQVQLKDLASIRDTIKDRTTYASLDGREAVLLEVRKQTDANAVEVVEAFDTLLAKLQPELPKGMRITKTDDTSHFVKMSNDAVWEHLVLGAILAVLVLFIFLRNGMAMLISGLAIPISVVATFVMMDLFGFTFNNLTMLALSLVVGILVDDAVVDLENIYRHMEMGEPPLKAAINATGEIQLAVTATTMSIVGVFLPMSFMSGTIGKFFKSFGLTVTFAVLFSLLVARTLTPMMCAYLLKVKPKPGGHEEVSDGRYARFLRACLAPARIGGKAIRIGPWAPTHRLTVIIVAIATFVGGMGLAAIVPKGFLSKADRGEFLLRVQLPKGSPLEKTNAVTDDVAKQVKLHPEVEHVVSTVNVSNPDVGHVTVLLVAREKRKIADYDLAVTVRNEFKTYPGAKVSADERGPVGGGENKPVMIKLMGDDLAELKHYADQLAERLVGESGLADVESSLGQMRGELRVIPDRERLAHLGIPAATLANTLRLATTGETPSTMSLGDTEVDLWVRLDPRYRQDLAALESLPVQGLRGSTPLGSLADVRLASGYDQIDRFNRQRLVTVSANLEPGLSLGTATQRIQRVILPQLGLPASIEVDMGGAAESQRDAFSGFGQAMQMGVLAIFFILALQFGSFLNPLTIMLSLPLSLIGAMLGLLIGGKEMGMMALIGIIMLMGIVTKNAILIVDFIITMRERGYSRDEAVVRGAQVRLRPILMTTAAMILGMLPIALGIGAGSEFRAPMGVAVIGGLLTSTGLTLVVVPVVYTLLDDLKGWFMRVVLRRPTEVGLNVPLEGDASTHVPLPGGR